MSVCVVSLSHSARACVVMLTQPPATGAQRSCEQELKQKHTVSRFS